MSENQEIDRRWTRVLSMTKEAGFTVNSHLIKKLAERAPDDFEKAHTLLEEGKADDLAIEPFFLNILCQSTDIQSTEEVLEGMSARQRVEMVNWVEAEKRIGAWERRFRDWAFHIFTAIVVSYPVVVGLLAYQFIGLPYLPTVEGISDASAIQLSLASWAAGFDEFWQFPMYSVVAFFPSFLVGLVFFGIILSAAAILRYPRLRD